MERGSEERGKGREGEEKGVWMREGGYETEGEG